MAQYVLEILDGERAGEVVRLSERLRIGRKPVNDLVINDEKTSGVHAEVVLEGERHVDGRPQTERGGADAGRRVPGRPGATVLPQRGREVACSRRRRGAAAV